MFMPSLNYCFASLAVGAGVWLPAYYRIPLVVGIAGVLACLCIAVLVMDRQMGLRLPLDLAHARSEVDSPVLPVRAVIVGDGPTVDTLAESLARNTAYEFLGVVSTHPTTGGWPYLGPPERAERILDELGVEEVLVAPAPTWEEEMAARLAGDDLRVSVRMVATPATSLLDYGRLGNRGDIAVIPVGLTLSPLGDVCKRAMDWACSGLALLLLSPLMLLLALLVRAGSRGPALFAQERVGRRGRVFTMYKFRTMVHDAEAETGPVLSTGKEDNRLTRVGRVLRACRLDELPQLWNVFRGDMSLVGPRPERPCFVKEYTRTIPGYASRHLVRPGITGLAQVYGDYHTTPKNKLRFDLIYVSRQSLALDMAILFQTFSVMFHPDRD